VTVLLRKLINFSVFLVLAMMSFVIRMSHLVRRL